MDIQIPKIAIIIVTYNSEMFLKVCLSSVYAQNTDFTYQVIVVDNGSKDNSITFTKTNFPNVEIIQNNKNVGFAKANNQGIRHSKAEILLFLNPDTILQENALQNLMDFYIKHPSAGVIGPKILNADGSLQRTGVAFPSIWNLMVEIVFLDYLFPYSKIFGRHRKLFLDPDKVNEVDYLQGSCLLVSRKVIDEIELFDESFFMYFEETDLCLRVKAKGYKVYYVPDASIVHFGGSGMSYYDRNRVLIFYKSYIQFLNKHFRNPQKLFFIIGLFLRSVLRCAVFFLLELFPMKMKKQYLNRSRGYFDIALFLLGVKK